MLSDILKRQFSGSEQLPKYGYHVTDSILSLRDDRLMFTVRAKGVPFEVTSDSVLENQYDSLNGFVLNIAKSAGSRLALWCHLDHFKTVFSTNYNFSYEWLNNFNANYMKKFEGKDIFENDFYLSFVLKPGPNDTIDDAIKEMEEMQNAVLQSIGHYEPELLTTYNRPREGLHESLGSELRPSVR